MRPTGSPEDTHFEEQIGHLEELEKISAVLFEGQSLKFSPQDLEQAKTLLEDVYMPETPNPAVFKSLLTYFDMTPSLVLKLAISERLGFYVKERWQFISEKTFKMIMNFTQEIIKGLEITHFQDLQTRLLANNIIKLMACLFVTFFNDYENFREIIGEFKNTIVKGNSSDSKDQLMLVLNLIETIVIFVYLDA